MILKTNPVLRNAMRIALYAGITSAAVVSAPVLAAEQGNENEVEEEIEEVIVTGSRIPRLDIEAAAPVQVLDAKDIERAGVTNVGQLLRQVPSMAGQAQTTQVNNGGDGSMRVSLRGLGSERTLVLINGRRVVPSGAGANSTVDLSTIPVALIERVEILKDGASAIYGSDAIAGVINLILKNDIDGVEVSGQYGETSEGDGKEQRYDLIAGRTFDDGNFTFHVGYADDEPIGAGDRDFSKVALSMIDGSPEPQGSSAPPWGRYNFDGNSKTLGPEFGAMRDWNWDTDTYNFAPANYLRQASERYHINTLGSMGLGDWGFAGPVKGFMEFGYTRRESEQMLAETPLAPLAFFGFDGPYSADNAYNPFGVEIPDWRRRMVEGGSRMENSEVTTQRLVFGVEGETDNGIGWDLSYNYGRTDATISASNLYNLERVAAATGPTFVDENGDLQCVNDPGNCVPLDVFSEGSVTNDMLDYIRFTSNDKGHTDLEIYAFNLFKDNVWELPAGGIGLAGGISYSESSGSDTPDSQISSLAATGAVTGTPRQPTEGEIDVFELYGEALIPLLSDMAFAESLEATIAFRYSDYNLFDSNTSGKLGLNWRVNDAVMFRGTAGDAFRAPSISELFLGNSKSFPQVADPCATDPNQNCQNDGVPADGFVPISTQIPEILGGNEELTPEEADIYTIGLVLTPSDQLSFTLDYYNIALTNAINTLGPQYILDSCHATGQHCDLIERFSGDPLTEGNPRLLDDRNINIGGVDTSGLDFGFGYTGLDIGFGSLNFRGEATYLIEYIKIMPDGTELDHTGRFIDDQDGNFPEWRVAWHTDWYMGNWDASWSINYISSVDETYEDWVTGSQDRSMHSVTYHDLLFGYNFEDQNARVAFGIKNVGDEQPPFSFDGFNDNTDVRTYDTAGRSYYLSAKIAF